MKTELTIESIFEQIDLLKQNIDKDYKDFKEKVEAKKHRKRRLFERVIDSIKALLI